MKLNYKINECHYLDKYLIVYIEKYCKIGPNKAAFIGSGLKTNPISIYVYTFEEKCFSIRLFISFAIFDVKVPQIDIMI